MPSIYLFRRKTAANWTSQNPVLMDGELGLETDTGLFKFGNGSAAWSSRPYAGASVGVVPWGAITGTLSAQTDLAAALAAKQATLVSATNIKTINGNSILGSGDLVISGGGSVSDGDKGDITVSSSGAVWRINEGAVNDENIVSVDWFKITSAPESFPSYWEGISGIPSEFPPSSHTHTASGITNFDSASRSVVLSGYSASGTRLALAATDTILGAFGKIGKWLSDLATVAFSGSASDLTTGTLPIDRIADGSITLAKVQDLSNTVSNMALVDVASGTIKGRATAGTGDPEDLTPSQARGVMNVPASDPTGITGADAITNIVSLTQAEYTAIVSPSATTLYVITDA